MEVVQGSPEWHQIRCAKVTGSRIKDVMAKGKGSAESVTRRNYLAQIACEVLTGAPMSDNYSNGHMQRGNEFEAAARQIYEFTYDVKVEQVAFIDHPHIPRHGISPDGIVGTDGMIEIKCPIPAIHIGYLLGGVTPTEYVKQMQTEMSCADRQWNDFVSYCPALPLELQLFVVREHRDQAMITEISAAVMKFLAEVDALVAQLEALRG
jgi:putative phage-type endonuclease